MNIPTHLTDAAQLVREELGIREPYEKGKAIEHLETLSRAEIVSAAIRATQRALDGNVAAAQQQRPLHMYLGAEA